MSLVECVEKLTRAGYLVLTADQAEETTVLLGVLVFGDEVGDSSERAVALLADFPEQEQKP